MRRYLSCSIKILRHKQPGAWLLYDTLRSFWHGSNLQQTANEALLQWLLGLTSMCHVCRRHAQVLLVSQKGTGWMFPRGKLNENETDAECAAREVGPGCHQPSCSHV